MTSVADIYVAFVGGGQFDEELTVAARTIGRAVAEAGAVLVCGGLGELLGAAMRGASEGGGTTVALLPGHDRSGLVFEPTVSLPTGLGEARNVLIVRSCHAMVAVGGGFGTLSEMALAARAQVPVVGYRTWTLQPPQLDGVEDPVIPASTPEDAAELAIALARS